MSMSTFVAIGVAIFMAPFGTLALVLAVVAAITDKPTPPKRRAPHQLPPRHATPYLARMTALTQIAQQKQRKTR